MDRNLLLNMDMVKPLSEEGGIIAWLTKIKLVVKLQNILDIASFIPFSWEEGILTLFLQFRDKNQNDTDMIKYAVKKVFLEGVFVAHGILGQIRPENQ